MFGLPLAATWHPPDGLGFTPCTYSDHTGPVGFDLGSGKGICTDNVCSGWLEDGGDVQADVPVTHFRPAVFGVPGDGTTANLPFSTPDSSTTSLHDSSMHTSTTTYTTTIYTGVNNTTSHPGMDNTMPSIEHYMNNNQYGYGESVSAGDTEIGYAYDHNPIFHDYIHANDGSTLTSHFQSKMMQDDSFYTDLGSKGYGVPVGTYYTYGHGYYYENNPNFHTYINSDANASANHHGYINADANLNANHGSMVMPTTGDNQGPYGPSYFSGSAYGIGSDGSTIFGTVKAIGAVPMVNKNALEYKKDDNCSSCSVPLISSAVKAPGAFLMPGGQKLSVVPQQPRPIIAKASPSHFVLTCHAITLAGIQSASSGDVDGKYFEKNATANAEAVTPVGAYLLRNALASLDKDRKGQMMKQQLDQLKVSYVQIDASSLMGSEYRRDAMGRVLVEDGLVRMLPQQHLHDAHVVVSFSKAYPCEPGTYTLPQGSYVQMDVSSLMGPQYRRDVMGRVIVEDGLARMLQQQQLNDTRVIVSFSKAYPSEPGTFTFPQASGTREGPVSETASQEWSGGDLYICSAFSLPLLSYPTCSQTSGTQEMGTHYCHNVLGRVLVEDVRMLPQQHLNDARVVVSFSKAYPSEPGTYTLTHASWTQEARVSDVASQEWSEGDLCLCSAFSQPHLESPGILAAPPRTPPCSPPRTARVKVDATSEELEKMGLELDQSPPQASAAHWLTAPRSPAREARTEV